MFDDSFYRFRPISPPWLADHRTLRWKARQNVRFQMHFQSAETIHWRPLFFRCRCFHCVASWWSDWDWKSNCFVCKIGCWISCFPLQRFVPRKPRVSRSVTGWLDWPHCECHLWKICACFDEKKLECRCYMCVVFRVKFCSQNVAVFVHRFSGYVSRCTKFLVDLP